MATRKVTDPANEAQQNKHPIAESMETATGEVESQRPDAVVAHLQGEVDHLKGLTRPGDRPVSAVAG